jgi:transcriptional regulator with XRE-family HTH domain
VSPIKKGGDNMAFDYSKLLGRIRERGYNQTTLAKKIGMHPSTLSEKLNNKYRFSVEEIGSIRKALDIPKSEIGVYFFDEKVQKC